MRSRLPVSTTRLLSLCLVAALPLALLGCPEDKPSLPPAPPTSPASGAAPASAQPATTATTALVAAPSAPAACKASPAWIATPTMPAEVAATESFCDFYQFSWQWFLAQVSPSKVPGERVFESNRVYVPGASGQCAAKALTGRAAGLKALSMRVPKPKDFEDRQADGNVLYDQRGNILYASLWYSAEECASTAAGFAPGTLELKLTWTILPKADPAYFTMEAVLPGGKTPSVLGLLGFHLVNWTSKHPEMIWASFEHKNNAPLCNGTSGTGPFPLASDAAAACLAKNAQPGTSGPPPAACASFAFNTAPVVKGTPPATGKPVNVCRQFEHGSEPGTSVNGNDNATNLLAIQQLNAQLVGPDGLLTRRPDSDPMAVWKNYEMVGGLWTKGGAASGNEPVPSAGGPADPTSPQRGSLELTNMTMETFQQGSTSFIPNCFGCHNYVPTAPLTVSHISSSLFSFALGNKAKK